MHLSHLRLRDFRNYARLDLDFGPGFQLLLGNNAQGKTSVLEAIYLLATLRSFRGTASGGMVRQGQEGYFVQGRVGGPLPLSLGLYWSNQERRVLCDGEPARTLSAFLEGLRAVVFSSEDLEMVRGPARIRRRFLDLLQVHSRPADLSLLQRYARTLRSRNALLRQPDVPPSVLEGFDHELVRAGQQIMESRRQLVPRISELAAQACEGIAGQGESLALEYRPSVKEDFARELIQSRDRESRQGSTVVGPHRDNLLLRLDGQDICLYGSEGQKRSVAIALKMAQATWLARITGVAPVLLLDDVMGELDLCRRSGLVGLLQSVRQEGGQVFMTCTEQNWKPLEGEPPARWWVEAGTIRPLDGQG